jgi:SAM-dependent methyltransferase
MAVLDPDGAVRRRMRAALRGALPQRLIWRRALPSEVAFWSSFLATEGLDQPHDYARRFNPSSPVIEPLILDALDEIASDPVRILDVGAGPVTWLGYRHPGRALEITAVDPLADEYARLLADHDVQPPLATIPCAGEQLLERFGEASFDIAYARNALDHSADPAAIISNMLAVVRPGGWVLLRHYETEAQLMRYEELHQWNFEIDGERPVIWNRRTRVDLEDHFGAQAEMSGSYEEGSAHARWVTCRLRKRRQRD